jgi:hypothetical protein
MPSSRPTRHLEGLQPVYTQRRDDERDRTDQLKAVRGGANAHLGMLASRCSTMVRESDRVGRLPVLT